MAKYIMMIVNDTNFVWNLRREVLARFIDLDYKVTLVTEILGFKEELEKLGIRIIDIKAGRRGTNAVRDIQLFLNYLRIIKSENPDLVLTNNIKPNVYGGLACQFCHIKYIVNVCGLGTPLEKPGSLQKLAVILYKNGIRKADAIFFQNTENRQFFVDRRMIQKETNIILTPGSGVNLDVHQVLPWNEEDIHFLFAARIMKEKGIDLFLAAARKYASKHIIFDVCGQCDDKRYKEVLQNEKSIKYHGLQKNLIPFFRLCTCFLYPTYYPEGMSNVLLEAAACGRPVITTDRSGCREIVEDGVTGYLVPENDEQAVLDAVEVFLGLTVQERKEMGFAGRKLVERQYDRKTVIEMFVNEVGRVIGNGPSRPC